MAGRGHGPDTFRPLMFPAICEKAFHVVTMAVLFAQGRIQTGQLAVALPDFMLGCLFIASVVVTRGGSTS